MNKKKVSSVEKSDMAALAKKVRHPAEIPLSILSAVITIGFFVLMAIFLVKNNPTTQEQNEIESFLTESFDLDEETAHALIKFGAWLVIIILVLLFLKYILTLIDEENRAITEGLTCRDAGAEYIQEIADEYARILGLESVPKLYFVSDSTTAQIFNANVYGERFLAFSAVEALTEKSSDENLPKLRFRIATKLGNISLGYNNLLFQVLTLSGRIIPIFRSFYIKTLIYSSDRMALEILQQSQSATITKEDVARALYLRGYDYELHEFINWKQAVQDKIDMFNQQSRLNKLYIRIASVEPLITDRITAILDYPDSHGPLL